MKIYYLSFSNIPSRDASSVHVMNMCHSLAKEGHDVTLFAKQGNHEPPDIYAYYGVSDSFKLVRSIFPRTPIIGDMIYSLETLRKLFFSPKPDLYYGRHPHLIFFMSFRPVPIAYEVHDVPTLIFQKTMERQITKSKNLVRLVAISQSLKEEYLRIFPWLTDSDVLVAHDGARTSDHQTSVDTIQKRKGALQVGYVGNLYPGRGIDLILKLAKHLPEMDFHIVGGTEEDLRTWKSKKLSPNIQFYGYVPHHQTAGYLVQFDILLSPHQEKVALRGGKGNIAQWMSPLKIFEYMAAGKAILCSNLPVLREILQDGKNAILLPPDDLNQWISAIKRLESNPELRENLSKNAYQQLYEQYTWDKRVQKISQHISI